MAILNIGLEVKNIGFAAAYGILNRNKNSCF